MTRQKRPLAAGRVQQTIVWPGRDPVHQCLRDIGRREELTEPFLA
jgi:hypothetical protein